MLLWGTPRVSCFRGSRNSSHGTTQSQWIRVVMKGWVQEQAELWTGGQMTFSCTWEITLLFSSIYLLAFFLEKVLKKIWHQNFKFRKFCTKISNLKNLVPNFQIEKFGTKISNLKILVPNFQISKLWYQNFQSENLVPNFWDLKFWYQIFQSENLVPSIA